MEPVSTHEAYAAIATSIDALRAAGTPLDGLGYLAKIHVRDLVREGGIDEAQAASIWIDLTLNGYL